MTAGGPERSGEGEGGGGDAGACVADLLGRTALVFSWTAAPSLPAELSAQAGPASGGAAEVVALVERLDPDERSALSRAIWEVPVAARAASLPGLVPHALLLRGRREGIARLARRAGAGRAGAALARALAAAAAPRPERGRILGIRNVTPDAFSDGGVHLDLAAAVARAEEMVAEGADLVDVGGESTRPGADPVPEDVERARVVGVVRELCRRLPVPVSVDTSRSGVARAVLDEGARMINDVTALRRDPEIARVVAAASTGPELVLMHSRGTPQSMQSLARYDCVVVDVARELARSAAAAIAAGVPPSRVLVDPGLGFAKTAEHNLELLAHLAALRSLGFPLVVGASRKSFLGKVTGLDAPRDRVTASVAAAVVAALRGASVVRVHDVRATRESLAVVSAVRARERP
jgi:dihydropteroate synthase